ncbi:hypothetical protein pipiens_010998 [Culex pipiens pipiens]|uniref:Uncharacterized protein n=1 Tax=Culex pipiens pipiens TaxID=38569 RepID=A0ABD1D7Y9_CULPP
MGILLPPVSQVTNTRINMTQHHRNRSLDSALQRIPEVEVSSPSAESENTLCTNSILGATMCTKIIQSSSTNPTNTPTAVQTRGGHGADSGSSSGTSSNRSSGAGLDGSGPGAALVPGSRTTDKAEGGGGALSRKESDAKKREDLTSLGSDDSGKCLMWA